MLDTAHKLRNQGGGKGPEIWMKMVTWGQRFFCGYVVFGWCLNEPVS